MRTREPHHASLRKHRRVDYKFSAKEARFCGFPDHDSDDNNRAHHWILPANHHRPICIVRTQFTTSTEVLTATVTASGADEDISTLIFPILITIPPILFAASASASTNTIPTPTGSPTSYTVEPTADGAPQYVRSVRFNDQVWDQSWIPTRDLHRGGTLQIDLGPTPSAWGTTSRPPSVTPPGAGHRPPSGAPVPLAAAG